MVANISRGVRSFNVSGRLATNSGITLDRSMISSSGKAGAIEGDD
jgi:hypothetical protein